MSKKNILIVFLILCLLFSFSFIIFNEKGMQGNAFAQSDLEKHEYIKAVPVQVERNTFGLAMIDTLNQTIWFYKFDGRSSGGNNIRLLGGRTYKYDRLLQQYNTADPKPEQVKDFLKRLGTKMPDNEDVNEEDIMKVVGPDN